MTSGKSKRIVYFGNERLVSGLDKTDAPILRGLIDKGYDVVAVVSHHSASNSRNQRQLEVAEIAREHNIPVLLPNRPSDIIDELKGLDADIAVLAAYGRIISQQVIDIFPLGIINIHPSLLPKYRGPTPIESAILNGDTETGVSIMQLSAGMDEGPVYGQQTLPIDEDESKLHLYSKIVSVGVQLFFDIFPQIIDGSLSPTPQDTSKATYSSLIKKSDGSINWNQDAENIERQIRAYTGWPQSRTKLGNIDVIITGAHAIPGGSVVPGRIEEIDTNPPILIVAAAYGNLCIERVKPLGKKEMPIAAFLAGYKSQLSA